MKALLDKKIVQYLIDFLVGPLWIDSVEGDRFPRRFDAIGYTDSPEEMKRYPVVIKPSNFFSRSVYGTEEAYPKPPLQQWRGIPLLFGEPREEWNEDGTQLILHADLIASAYFLVSRYEEMYRRPLRDEYGRFPGRESLPHRAGFLHRPIIDEYGAALREILVSSGLAERHGFRLEERPETFSRVNLTHDLSRPYNYRGVRSLLRAVLKEQMNPLDAFRLSFAKDKEDDYYTFPKFLRWDRATCDVLGEERASIHLFIRVASNHPLDKPSYDPLSPYMRRVLAQGERFGARLGLQCSYASGYDTRLMTPERETFEHLFKQKPEGFRHNRLAGCEPEDLVQAYIAGLRHDYTMGYADLVGFRLGTCRPVRFINPNTRLLVDVVMHPLILRDLTLSDPRYMGLSHEEAGEVASELIRTTARYHGELTMLWHNDLLSQQTHPWHSVLYRSLLRQIEELA